MCRSVPQMDATFTLTKTSFRPKAGILTSRISAPGAASGLTTASIVDGIRIPYEFRRRYKTYDSSTAGATLRLTHGFDRLRRNGFELLRLASRNAEAFPLAGAD